MNVSYAVQHHPSRAHLLAALGERLGGYDLVSDPEPDGEPSPLRCYRECLACILAKNACTHGVIVQDDAEVCVGFRDLAEAAIAEKPDKIIAFFVPGIHAGGQRRMWKAAQKGDRWAQIGGLSIVPLVAACWPKALAEEFLEFSEHPRYLKRRGDDAVAASFVKMNRLEVWATVPSFVEHPNTTESLIGKTSDGAKSQHRVAALFIDRV